MSMAQWSMEATSNKLFQNQFSNKLVLDEHSQLPDSSRSRAL